MKRWAPRIGLIAQVDIPELVGVELFQRGADDPVVLTAGLFIDHPDLLNGRGSAAVQTLAGQIQAAADFEAGGFSDEVWATDITRDDRVRIYCDGGAGGTGVAFTITGGSALGFTDGQASALVTIDGESVQAITAARDWSRETFAGQLTISTAGGDYLAPQTAGQPYVLTMLRERGAVGGPDDGTGASCLEALDQAASSSSAIRHQHDARGCTVITWPDAEGLDPITWLSEDGAAMLGYTGLAPEDGGEAPVKISTTQGDLWVYTSALPAAWNICPSRARFLSVFGREWDTEGGRLANGRPITRAAASRQTLMLEWALDGGGDRVTWLDLEDHYDRFVRLHAPPGASITVYQDWPGELRRHRWHTDIRPSAPAHALSYTADRSPRRGRLIVDREGANYDLSGATKHQRAIRQAWRLSVPR